MEEGKEGRKGKGRKKKKRRERKEKRKKRNSREQVQAFSSSSLSPPLPHLQSPFSAPSWKTPVGVTDKARTGFAVAAPASQS
jgi:hypothetical protein